MDVADGSAAEKAEAHLRGPITGGKVCLGFLAVDSLSHITHSLTDLLRTHIFLSLFASHFHSFAFFLLLSAGHLSVYHAGAPLSLTLLPAGKNLYKLSLQCAAPHLKNDCWHNS